MNSKVISKYIILYESLTGGIELLLGLGMFVFGQKIYLLYQHLKNLGFVVNSHGILAIFVRGLLPFVVQYRVAIGLFLLASGLVKIIGSVGIFFKKKWGGYILIISLLILAPFDIVAIIRRPTAIKLVYLIINISIIIYLLPKKIKKEFGKI